LTSASRAECERHRRRFGRPTGGDSIQQGSRVPGLKSCGPSGSQGLTASGGGREYALDLVDQLLVQVEEATEEVDYQQQLLLPVGQVLGAAL
jgi:hypothetical protein